MMYRAGRLAMMVGGTAAAVAGAAAAVAAETPITISPARVWAGACSYCHDEGVAPPIFGLGLGAAAIAAVVRGGLNGMPAFHPSELTEAQLQALADWVAQQPARTAPAGTAPAKP
jgi:mono/diheme cytochrome c family protein